MRACAQGEARALQRLGCAIPVYRSEPCLGRASRARLPKRRYDVRSPRSCPSRPPTARSRLGAAMPNPPVAALHPHCATGLFGGAILAHCARLGVDALKRMCCVVLAHHRAPRANAASA